jgi:hypothetical protein
MVDSGDKIAEAVLHISAEHDQEIIINFATKNTVRGRYQSHHSQAVRGPHLLIWQC